MSELPKSWLAIRLADVARVVSGYAFKSLDYSDKGIPLVRISNIQDGEIDLSDAVRIPKQKEKADFQIENGDILIALSGATTGKSGVYRSVEAALLNQRVGNIKPISSDVLDKRYLWFFIKSRHKEIEKAAYGGAQPNISPKDIGDFVFPLAPFNEQKRIVAKLDELLPKVEACKQRLEKIPTILKRFRQSVLADAVSGKLTEKWRKQFPDLSSHSLYQELSSSMASEKQPFLDEEANEIIEALKDQVPATWTVCQIGNVSRVMLGGTPSRKESTYWNGDIPWISSGEVANCEILTTSERISSLGLENSNAKLLQPGTILVAMIGEGKTRGQTAILRVAATSNQNSAALVFNTDLIIPEFMYFWMLYRYEATRSIGRGGNQPALNGEKVRNLPFVLPPLEEQRQIVFIVHEHLKKVDGLTRKIAVAREYSGKVLESVLGKAFCGELVAQNDTDESASILLERIKVSKAPKAKKALPKKRKSGKEEQSLSA